jgi:zona occludens toxin (predicted ATPase)
MTRKELKKQHAKEWANKEGLLRIDQIITIIGKSWSRVRDLSIMGDLKSVKDGPPGSRSRVWITLQSVLEYIDKWEE